MQLQFQNLAPISSFIVSYQALEDQLLPPLPTTAFHGAFLTSLKALTCPHPARLYCNDCRSVDHCDYARLAEPAGKPGNGQGVASRAPAAFVIGCDTFHPLERSVLLKSGEKFSFRLCLIGSWPLLTMSLVNVALSKVAGLGLGRPSRRSNSSNRPGLAFVDLQPDQGTSLPSASTEVQLRFLTPVRMVDDGSVSSNVSAELLTRTMIRRADSLARIYGGGALLDSPDLDSSGFTVRRKSMRVVNVHRYSSRQQQKMAWPGLFGDIELEGPGLEKLWPLFQFCEKAQIGKATGFGFGRYQMLIPEPIFP